MFTGVMRDRRLDISEAAITTQPDGTALQTLVVRSITAPDPQVLEQDLRAALCGTLSAAPVFDAEVLFDHDALRPFTRCDVRAADRVGLLHSLAAAFAVAGADVRSAGVSTDDGVAHDAFDLAATRGGQLNDATERRIVGLIRCGVHEWKAPLAGSRWLTRH